MISTHVGYAMLHVRILRKQEELCTLRSGTDLFDLIVLYP